MLRIFRKTYHLYIAGSPEDLHIFHARIINWFSKVKKISCEDGLATYTLEAHEKTIQTFMKDASLKEMIISYEQKTS